MPAAFSRRRFLAFIGLAAAVPAASATPVAAQPAKIELLRRPVAGLPYYRYAEVAERIAPGMRLMLRREPWNQYDRRAIAVFTEDGAKLGYVPRIDNPALAALMDSGHELSARAAGPGRRDPTQLWMTVALIDRRSVVSATDG